MKTDLDYLGNLILKNKEAIVKEVNEIRLEGVSEEERKQFANIEKEILQKRDGLISMFGDALKQLYDEEAMDAKLAKWGKETGEYIFNLGIPLDEALLDTAAYRKSIWKAVSEGINEKGMSADLVLKAGSIIDPLLDKAAYFFSLTFINYHQITLENAKSAFLELSVPVVPLTQGVGILPLIGNIDTERAALLMEETLKQAGKLKLSHLIVDLSGVLIVDTMVADQIFKVIDALRLLGVKTIVTGVRPEIAQTVINIGIDFKDIEVKGNLQKALMGLGNMQTP
ncbi:rsbT co-antagonist protein RsbR [Bacillus sp. OV322]|uniref:STAS domain-containing protein n=1 Tax=Bacillus sp. OV322 TaxID=1882764 RepID=UPI0008F05BC2|nr:STAS domain-containing protein [Bacillus sp. OV322]SFC68113.1 rsbT co-antagonist protein RsbR [Bacillus sp. OV322]